MIFLKNTRQRIAKARINLVARILIGGMLVKRFFENKKEVPRAMKTVASKILAEDCFMRLL